MIDTCTRAILHMVSNGLDSPSLCLSALLSLNRPLDPHEKPAGPVVVLFLVGGGGGARQLTRNYYFPSNPHPEMHGQGGGDGGGE